MPRFLFGPVVDESFRDRFLHAPVTAGSWAAFSAACPSWDAAVAATGGEPEVVLVWPAYTSVPAWVWSAPVPVVALAADANLLAHGYRHLLPLADLVLADAPSAERMRRGGVAPVRTANLFGLDRHFRAEIDALEGERPVDVAFVGNLSPAVQAGRARWLGRLGALAARSRVVIGTGLVGEGYRRLLRSGVLSQTVVVFRVEHCRIGIRRQRSHGPPQFGDIAGPIVRPGVDVRPRLFGPRRFLGPRSTPPHVHPLHLSAHRRDE